MPRSSLQALGIVVCGSLFLSGCVAAVVPIAAAAMMARKHLKLPSERLRRAARPQGTAPVGPAKPGAVELTKLTSLPTPSAAPPSPFEAFAAYAMDQHKLGLAGEKRASVVMAPDSTLSSPTVVPCDQRPTAVMVDADLQSGGAPLAGALDRLRSGGLNVLWVLDDGDDASVAPAALDQAGFEASDTVLISQRKGQRKQLVRQLATIDHCIVAIAGRRRGDMDELYNYLRNPNTPVPSDILWNQGWFLIPAPLAARPATKGTP